MPPPVYCASSLEACVEDFSGHGPASGIAIQDDLDHNLHARVQQLLQVPHKDSAVPV